MSAPGRVSLVSGAGSGIGRAIALRLADEGPVALGGRSVGALESVRAKIAALGGESSVVPFDVTDAGAVAGAVAETLDRYGRIDLLCANSGVAGPTAPVWEVDAAAWQETFAVNVAGVFHCCRAVLPSMIAAGRGAVVVVGSTSGKAPLPGRAPYCASKTALTGLVRTVAAEAGPYGVRVNLVSPGPVAGSRLDRVVEAQARLRGESVDEVRAAMLAAVPLRRFTEASEIAQVVAFLGSPAASAVTGQDLVVAAGGLMA